MAEEVAKKKVEWKKIEWIPLDPPNGDNVQEVGNWDGQRFIRTLIIPPGGSSYYEVSCDACPSKTCQCRVKSKRNKADAKRSIKRSEGADPVERSARNKANYQQSKMRKITGDAQDADTDEDKEDEELDEDYHRKLIELSH